ncbi:MAG TPA: hypothetical protein PLQ78_10810, partial [Flavipsychrobacter sp.]|nr:hypothetical protein [Flavipsychrobacter sp.]
MSSIHKVNAPCSNNYLNLENMEVSISKIRTVFKRWYILFLVGVLSLAVGIAIYSLPAISLPFLLLMCSMFLVVVGIREIIYI